MINKLLRQNSFIRIQVSLLAVVVFGSTPVRAEDAYVPACVGAALNSCPPSCAVTGTTTLTSTVSSAPGVPARTRAAIGIVSTMSWTVTPTLLQQNGVYKIYITKGTSGNASTNLVVSMTTSNGDLADFSGYGTNSVMLTNFNAASAINVWIPIGYITNNTTTPTIALSYVSGFTGTGTGGRWYMDVIRFENLDPCTGVAPLVEATGPLSAGQTFVNVTGVSAGATNVTAYVGALEIGSTNYAAGFAAGTVTVPTSPLVKDSEITATQTKVNSQGNPCISQPAPNGPLVGGGSNPKISLALGVLQNAALTGPAGANTGGAGTQYWIKATDTVGNASATAPVGGAPLIPGQCWQSVSFSWADPGLNWQSSATLTDANPFAGFEHLAFAIDDLDSGPCDIYVDSIMNGDTVIENFEGFTNGASVMFLSPNAATVPNPGPTYISSPNSSAVSQSYAFDGTNSCRVRWQFRDTADSRWVRLLAGAPFGKRYPQLDTSKPVTVRLLVLPVGVTTDLKLNGTVSSITNSGPAYAGTTNTLGVTVTGPGPYTYQWSFSGGGLANPTTNSTYTIDGFGAGLSVVDNGTYSVDVSDGTCTETRIISLQVADPIPTITNQPAQAIINQGSTLAVMTVGADGHVPNGYPLFYQWRANGVDITDQTLDTLWITNASVANALGYDVVVGNAYGYTTSIVATVDVVPVGILPGTGTGLRADYRTLHYSTNAFSGAPTLSRTDATVDFDWGSFGSPAPSISADYFTARWTGQVQALGDDTYTFSTISDDGVRLWVNGQALVDNWTLHGPTTDSGTIALTGMNKYDVTMEFFENAVGAVAKLYWANASGTVGFEAVPKSQLYPAPAGTAVPTLTHSQPDATHITFTWGVGTYNLAWSTNIAGPYNNIIYGVTSPYTVTIGNEPQKYFRLLVE